jgi:hypothetical protein
MKKQNCKNGSDNLEQISGNDMESFEKIWKISKSEFPEDALINLEDYPELIKKTKASLKVVVDKSRCSNEQNQLNSQELISTFLEILEYMILEIQISQVKSCEGCRNMYV